MSVIGIAATSAWAAATGDVAAIPRRAIFESETQIRQSLSQLNF